MAFGSQQRIGAYRLLNVIMTGQTSQVWEAMHDSSGTRYALKMLLTDFRRDREQIGYLKQEWEVGSKLKHPNVINLVDFSPKGESPYLVMEYFPWPNIKQYINAGVERFAFMLPQIIERAATGLAYFNEQGWIHRDIKPDNYLLTDEGDVRLIDFALGMRPKKGLAKMFATKTKVQGTRSYMSPEQIRGQLLDQRADVYSFGCTAYEMVTGKRPYTGVSANDLLMKHLKAAPPPADATNRNVTPEFTLLLQRMIAKKPEKRPESMTQFLTEFKSMRVFKEPPKLPNDEE